MRDLIERLRNTPCNREPFTEAHADCQCRVANAAASELEKLEHRLAAAYQRGVNWWIENGDHVDSEKFVAKAAYDYADYVIATWTE